MTTKEVSTGKENYIYSIKNSILRRRNSERRDGASAMGASTEGSRPTHEKCPTHEKQETHEFSYGYHPERGGAPAAQPDELACLCALAVAAVYGTGPMEAAGARRPPVKLPLDPKLVFGKHRGY